MNPSVAQTHYKNDRFKKELRVVRDCGNQSFRCFPRTVTGRATLAGRNATHPSVREKRFLSA